MIVFVVAFNIIYVRVSASTLVWRSAATTDDPTPCVKHQITRSSSFDIVFFCNFFLNYEIYVIWGSWKISDAKQNVVKASKQANVNMHKYWVGISYGKYLFASCTCSNMIKDQTILLFFFRFEVECCNT